MKNPSRAILLTVALAATGLGSGCGSREATPPAPAPMAATNPAPANAPNAPAAASNPAFEKLKGKWERPDGGYILEIRSVAADGKLDAGYFNPRPINVSKAQAVTDGKTVGVFVELRDVNYPGSTYTLAYDAASDSLIGMYYQAALKRDMEVAFVRMKP